MSSARVGLDGDGLAGEGGVGLEAEEADAAGGDGAVGLVGDGDGPDLASDGDVGDDLVVGDADELDAEGPVVGAALGVAGGDDVGARSGGRSGIWGV